MIKRGKPLTASQKLWGEVFGLAGIPELDEKKVLSLVAGLPEREALAVRLRYGFKGRPLSLDRVKEKLPRADGRIGLSREMTRLILRRAIRILRHPRRCQDWEEARLSHEK